MSQPKRPLRRLVLQPHKCGPPLSRKVGLVQDSLISNSGALTSVMDPYGFAGVPFRHDGQGPSQDYSPSYPSRSITSSGNNHMPTIGHDSAVNDGATGHLFNQGAQFGQFLQQGGLIRDPQANPSFEYNQSPRHVPPTEHDHLQQPPPSSFIMKGDAGMQPIIPPSPAFSLGLRTLLPVPPHPPASSLSSYALPSQRPREICQHPAPSQYLSHVQMSSPLQAMVSNVQGPSEPDPIKWSDEQTEAIKALFLEQAWYVDPDEEPPIRLDDPFITQGLILRTDKTRFSAFVFSSPTGGKAFCRIKHSPTKNKLVECTFSAAHPKDAIAHVCDYLNYRPYKCKGTKWHTECDSTYSTKERRNDHYAKKKKGPDPLKSCEGCGASITTRNVLRHKETCSNINTVG